MQTTGTGCWGNENPGSPKSTGAGRTADELRMYCGNSFTITCTDPNYEISKVKVYYSGSNEISGGEFLGTGRYLYVRFVEDRIDLPKEQTITGFGSNETLQVNGMDYDDTNPDEPDKYIIVDRIEVKCTKKATSATE